MAPNKLDQTLGNDNHDSSVGTNDTVRIASQGDVILVVGKDDKNVKLLVSSYMLRASSPVFEVMFGPNFAEGQGLSSASPKEVELKEDDSRAMKLVCVVLHSKHDSLPTKVDDATLQALSLIIDKYALREAMSLAMSQWLDSYEQDNPTRRLGTDLTIATKFEYAESFLSITDDLIKLESRPYPEVIKPGSSIALWRVCIALEQERTRLRSSIYDAIQELSNVDCDCAKPCQSVGIYHRDLTAALRKNGMTVTELAKQSITTTCRKLLRFDFPKLIDNMQAQSCYHAPQQIAVLDTLKDKLDDIGLSEGLCYYCTCYENEEDRKCDHKQGE